MRKYTILKLLGLSVLTMIVLVLLSILEVAIYSYLVNPGHDTAFYEAHAEKSAPYISAIFGFIIFFLVTRHWTRKRYANAARLAILFPVVYVILDIIIITASGADWAEFILISLIANAAKLLGSYLGYRLNRVEA